MHYMVVIEEGPTSFGAYVPDLPDCISVGETSQEALQLIQEAIEFHIEGLKKEYQHIPMPHSASSFVEVQA
jgi:predicted RNase H-like HicB family nuclease